MTRIILYVVTEMSTPQNNHSALEKQLETFTQISLVKFFQANKKSETCFLLQFVYHKYDKLIYRKHLHSISLSCYTMLYNYVFIDVMLNVIPYCYFKDLGQCRP